MPTIAELKATITLDANHFITGLNKAKGSLTDFEGESKKAGKGAGSFADALSVFKGNLLTSVATAIVDLTKKVVEFGSECADLASDVGESTSKINTLFGKSAKVVEDFARTTATQLGLSRREALEAAGTFGNLFRSLQVGQADSANLSKELVRLASDLASFNNTSITDAIDALKSGITGESEPLKKYGVVINETILKQQALKMGLIETTKDGLDPQAKALATLGLITEQTKNAQGDFAKTADGLANSQRILAARTEDLKTKFGEVLFPVKKFVVEGLNVLLERISKVNFSQLIDGITETFKRGIDSFTQIIGVMLSPFQQLFEIGKAWGSMLAGGLLGQLRAMVPKKILDSLGLTSGAELVDRKNKQTEDVKNLRALRYYLNEKSTNEKVNFQDLRAIPQRYHGALTEYGGINTKYNTVDVDTIERAVKSAEKALADTRANLGNATVTAPKINVPSLKSTLGTATGNYNPMFDTPAGDGGKQKKAYESWYQRYLAQTAEVVDKVKQLTLTEFDYKMDVLKREVEAYKKAGVNRLLVDEYYFEQSRKLRQAYLDKLLKDSVKPKYSEAGEIFPDRNPGLNTTPAGDVITVAPDISVPGIHRESTLRRSSQQSITSPAKSAAVVFWNGFYESFMQTDFQSLGKRFTEGLIFGGDGLQKFWQSFVDTGKKYLVEVVWQGLIEKQFKSLFDGLIDSISTAFESLKGSAVQIITAAYGLMAVLGQQGKKRQTGGIIGALVGGAIAWATGGAALPWIAGGASVGSAVAGGNIGEILLAGAGAASSINSGPKEWSYPTRAQAPTVTQNIYGNINNAADLASVNEQLGRKFEQSMRLA